MSTLMQYGEDDYSVHNEGVADYLDGLKFANDAKESANERANENKDAECNR